MTPTLKAKLVVPQRFTARLTVQSFVVSGLAPSGPPGPPGPQGPPLAVQDEGIALPQRSYLNFTGTGVTAADDLANNRTVVTIPGGGGGGTNLDYSGGYAPGTYNDGDIVIAEDGIAYMCVKAGVTTPPEPWPGVGIATTGPEGPQGPPGVTNPFRLGHTWALVGDVTPITILPSIFVPLRATETAALVGLRTKISSGTSVGVQVRRNGSNVGSVITVTTVAATTSFSTALTADDELTLSLSSPVGTPTNLSATLYLEHTPT